MTLKLLPKAEDDRSSIQAMLRVLRQLCPSADLDWNEETGEVFARSKVMCEPYDADHDGQLDPLPTCCDCICRVINHPRVVSMWEDRMQDGKHGAVVSPNPPEDNKDAHLDGTGCDADVVIELGEVWEETDAQNPGNGDWRPLPDWSIMANALCGHAMHIMMGDHIPEADDSNNDQAKAAENACRDRMRKEKRRGRETRRRP